MQTNCVALCKLVLNKKLNTVRLVFSFDKHNVITVKNAVLVTGDICDAADKNASVYIARAIADAKATLRTNNVQIVS